MNGAVFYDHPGVESSPIQSEGWSLHWSTLQGHPGLLAFSVHHRRIDSRELLQKVKLLIINTSRKQVWIFFCFKKPNPNKYISHHIDVFNLAVSVKNKRNYIVDGAEWHLQTFAVGIQLWIQLKCSHSSTWNFSELCLKTVQLVMI